MLIICGLIILLAAIIVGIAGVVTNAGASHLLTDDFAVLGYHVTGSTGTVFLYGIVIGATAGVGLSVLLVGARRAVNRSHAAADELKIAATTVHSHRAVSSSSQMPNVAAGRWSSLTQRLSRWLTAGGNAEHLARRRPTPNDAPCESTAQRVHHVTSTRTAPPGSKPPTESPPAITPHGRRPPNTRPTPPNPSHH